MWHTDPDLTMQLERERQEEMIRNHQRRQTARRVQGSRGMVRTILGLLGDALVDTGERLRRRAQMASPMAGSYRTGGFPTDLIPN